jgi:hypothetical protein
VSFNDRMGPDFNRWMGCLRGDVRDWKEQATPDAIERLTISAESCGAVERAITIDYLTPFMGAEWARVFAAPREPWSVCRAARSYLEGASPPPWPKPTDAALKTALHEAWTQVEMPLYNGAAPTPRWRHVVYRREKWRRWQEEVRGMYYNEYRNNAAQSATFHHLMRNPPVDMDRSVTLELCVVGGAPVAIPYHHLPHALRLDVAPPLQVLVDALRVANDACAGWLVASLRADDVRAGRAPHVRNRLADLIEAPAP